MPKWPTQSGPFTEYRYGSVREYHQTDRKTSHPCCARWWSKDGFEKGQNYFNSMPILSKDFLWPFVRGQYLEVNRSGVVILWNFVSTILVAAIHYFLSLFPFGTAKPRASLLWPVCSPLKFHLLLLNRILQQLEYTTKSVYTVWVPFLHFPVFLANLCSL